MKTKLCRWCKTPTVRHSGICQQCTDRRDAYDKLIDEGKAKYIPPTERPGHRFYERMRREPTEAQKAVRNAFVLRKKGIVEGG